MRRLNLSRSAEKSLRRVPQKPQKQLAEKLLQLSIDPRPVDSKKLVDSDYFRVRVADYRIVYAFSTTTVEVLLVDHRDQVYRRLPR